MTTADLMRDAHPRRRIVWLSLIGASFVLGASLAWLTWTAMEARDALQAARTDVGLMQEQARAGQVEAARVTLRQVQDDAALARSRTSGPLWAVAGVLPGVGPNVQAVQAVAGAVDELAQDALPMLVEATGVLDPTTLAPVDGRIDLDPLVAVAPQLVAADEAVRASLEHLTDVDVDGLMAQVAGPVDLLRSQLAGVGADTATAARAAELLPAMLGADGPRHYLLLVQNNAEPRALGGIPGAVILLRADDGAVELVELRNAAGVLSGLPEPALPLTDVERSLFGEQLGIYMADVTFTPDFPRAAELAQAMWEQRIGGDIDGVVSIDTGGLAAILGATGPVDLPPGPVADEAGGQLTEANAVEVLNNTVYRLIEDFAEQDAFYAATGAAIFGAALAGTGSPAQTVEALATAARDRQLMLWSAHPEEQARLYGTVLSNELRGLRDGTPVIGLFVNDGTGSKIGYYLDADVQVSPGACAVDGSRLIDVAVTFTSTAPSDVVDMPPYISGGRVLEPGRMRFNILAYAPQGGLVEDVEVSDGSRGGASYVHDDLFVVARTVELDPGESKVVDYQFRTGTGQSGAPEVRITPLVRHGVNLDDGWLCG
ncbi:DUF4012 domain-containing protein [Cellulomonas sp. S1-8]|uniref:DUF4012 domain-containing protein n=1 Tax=Cellulomonas sp. S1-8 TaxID=2904790 RepID=UPI002244148A|nr:DUF4012 domain-containing protein [Cellulomonas sp. S1-8]UZN04134.1 DUF4012 domain-containing protein [Cellulomonas sp. S1-8]